MEGDTSKYETSEGDTAPARRPKIKRPIFELEANAIVKIGKIVRSLPPESCKRVTLYMSSLLEESGHGAFEEVSSETATEDDGYRGF